MYAPLIFIVVILSAIGHFSFGFYITRDQHVQLKDTPPLKDLYENWEVPAVLTVPRNTGKGRLRYIPCILRIYIIEKPTDNIIMSNTSICFRCFYLKSCYPCNPHGFVKYVTSKEVVELHKLCSQGTLRLL